MAVITNNIKKRFIRDYNLPITNLETSDFLYFIDLYDDLFDTKKKYRLLVETINHFGDEHKFMGAFTKLRETIIKEVSNTPEYKDLGNIVCMYKPKYQISGQNIYNPTFNGQIIGSLDLVSANFNSLREWSTKTVFDAKDYNEFISKFTDIEYFRQSKQLRQIIFGNLNPKKQQSIQKSILGEISDRLIDNTELFETVVENKQTDELPFRLAKAGTDELLILQIPDFLNNNLLKFSEAIKYALPPKYKSFIKIEFFKLVQIHPEKSYFAKEYVIGDKQVEFKNVPSLFYPQVFKHYFNMDNIREADVVFSHEGCKAKFIEKIY